MSYTCTLCESMATAVLEHDNCYMRAWQLLYESMATVVREHGYYTLNTCRIDQKYSSAFNALSYRPFRHASCYNSAPVPFQQNQEE